MLDDPELQEEAKRVVQQITEVIEDPVFQEEAERIAQPLIAKMSNHGATLDDLKALSEDPDFKKLAEQVAAPVKRVMSNEDIQEKAKQVAEQVKEVMADPAFVKESKRITKPMMAMIEEARQMQEVIADPSFQEEALRISEQMQAFVEEQQAIERASPQKKSLAALLLDESTSLSPLDKERQQMVSKYMEGRIEAFQGSNKAAGVAQVMECFIPDGAVKPIIDLHAPKEEYAEGREEIQYYLEHPPSLPVKFKEGSNTVPVMDDGKAIVKFKMRIGIGFAGVDKNLKAVYEFQKGSALIEKVTVNYDK
jgi:hypothetical protein